MIASGLERHTAASVRTDNGKAVSRAEKAIGEYAQVISGAYDDATPLLYRALSTTYAAVCDLQDDQDRLAEYLDGKLPGPTSKNPCQPIVRKLWHRVPTRDAVHRYASCIALARHDKVAPNGFAAWIKNRKGGIKKAAQDWSAKAAQNDNKNRINNARIAERDRKLATFKPIKLPAAVAMGRDPGLYLAVIRIVDGKAELSGILQADTKAVTGAVIRHGI